MEDYDSDDDSIGNLLAKAAAKHTVVVNETKFDNNANDNGGGGGDDYDDEDDFRGAEDAVATSYRVEKRKRGQRITSSARKRVMLRQQRLEEQEHHQQQQSKKKSSLIDRLNSGDDDDESDDDDDEVIVATPAKNVIVVDNKKDILDLSQDDSSDDDHDNGLVTATHPSLVNRQPIITDPKMLEITWRLHHAQAVLRYANSNRVQAIEQSVELQHEQQQMFNCMRNTRSQNNNTNNIGSSSSSHSTMTHPLQLQLCIRYSSGNTDENSVLDLTGNSSSSGGIEKDDSKPPLRCVISSDQPVQKVMDVVMTNWKLSENKSTLLLKHNQQVLNARNLLSKYPFAQAQNGRMMTMMINLDAVVYSSVMVNRNNNTRQQQQPPKAKKNLGKLIQLKLRNVQTKAEDVLELRLKEPFSVLAEQYRVLKQIPANQTIQLDFDGERLSLDETPQDQDMDEDGFLIDVKVGK